MKTYRVRAQRANELCMHYTVRVAHGAMEGQVTRVSPSVVLVWVNASSFGEAVLMASPYVEQQRLENANDPTASADPPDFD